jgi:hypothetical protein
MEKKTLFVEGDAIPWISTETPPEEKGYYLVKPTYACVPFVAYCYGGNKWARGGAIIDIPAFYKLLT